MMKPSPAAGVEIAGESPQLLRSRDSLGPPALARWRAAEARLYPLIMIDSGAYEAAVTLVCEAAEVLRWQCDTVAELVDADATAVLARCPSASVRSTPGFDPGVAFAAACAHRWTELTANQSEAVLEANQGGSR